MTVRLLLPAVSGRRSVVGAATGDQEDLLVVEAGERSFQGGRGEDALVAGLQERVALGVNGFEGELTDLVAP